jgi:hypothetical protein
VNVDVVDQWARGPGDIALNDRAGAMTLMGRVVKMSAGTGVHFTSMKQDRKIEEVRAFERSKHADLIEVMSPIRYTLIAWGRTNSSD